MLQAFYKQANRAACPALAEVGAACSVRCTCRDDFCPTHALFLATMSVGDARVYTCTCTVYDKLACTHLQNDTIGASLMSVSDTDTDTDFLADGEEVRVG